MADELTGTVVPKLRARPYRPNTIAQKIITVLSRPEPKTLNQVVDEVVKLTGKDEKKIKARVQFAISLLNIYSVYKFDRVNLTIVKRD